MFEQFKRFDTNDDFNLDTQEVRWNVNFLTFGSNTITFEEFHCEAQFVNPQVSLLTCKPMQCFIDEILKEATNWKEYLTKTM